MSQGTMENQPQRTSISKYCEKHCEYDAMISRVGIGRFKREFITKCPECEKEEKDRSVERIRGTILSYTELSFERVGIPLRYSSYELGDLAGKNEKQANIIKRCKGYVEKFNDLSALGTSLIFTGSPGTGKTMISLSMVKPLIKKMISKEDPKKFETGCFETSYTYCIYKNIYDLFDEIKSIYRKESQDSETDIIKKYTGTELLIIDEVGAQSNSEFETITLFRIINSRYENMKPTILISNLSEFDLTNYIGERTIDRFKENNGAVFVFDWESLRS